MPQINLHLHPMFFLLSLIYKADITMQHDVVNVILINTSKAVSSFHISDFYYDTTSNVPVQRERGRYDVL